MSNPIRCSKPLASPPVAEGGPTRLMGSHLRVDDDKVFLDGGFVMSAKEAKWDRAILILRSFFNVLTRWGEE